MAFNWLRSCLGRRSIWLDDCAPAGLCRPMATDMAARDHYGSGGDYGWSGGQITTKYNWSSTARIICRRSKDVRIKRILLDYVEAYSFNCYYCLIKIKRLPTLIIANKLLIMSNNGSDLTVTTFRVYKERSFYYTEIDRNKYK